MNSGDKANEDTELQHLNKAPLEEFNFEEGKDYDRTKEKFEIIGIKMDVHKSGVLYLKEMVHHRTITSYRTCS